MKAENKTSRRQWFSGSLRWGLLAVFGGTSVYLLKRRPTIEETACLDPQGYTGCRECLELNGCKLPRALSVKQFLHKVKNEERKS